MDRAVVLNLCAVLDVEILDRHITPVDKSFGNANFLNIHNARSTDGHAVEPVDRADLRFFQVGSNVMVRRGILESTVDDHRVVAKQTG